MARIRTVKPELFRHEDLYFAERDYGLPLRVAFIGLFTACDRQGRFRWAPNAIKLDILPYDNLNITNVLDALVERGFVRKYIVNGRTYGCIPSFTKHQVINNREKESELPEYTEEFDACQSRASPVHYATLTPLVQDQGEGKGREGNKEGKGREIMSRPSDADDVDSVFVYWCEVMNKQAAKLTPKRERAVRALLKQGYTVTQIKAAIDGCRRSPYHMGNNNNRTVYDDLELICRTGEKMEQFAANTGTASGVETIDQFRDRASAQADRIAAILEAQNASE